MLTEADCVTIVSENKGRLDSVHCVVSSIRVFFVYINGCVVF